MVKLLYAEGRENYSVSGENRTGLLEAGPKQENFSVEAQEEKPGALLRRKEKARLEDFIAGRTGRRTPWLAPVRRTFHLTQEGESPG